MTAYGQALGARFGELPSALRMLHGTDGRFSGKITVAPAGSALLRRIARLMGLPPGGVHALVLEKTDTGREDRWRRHIGDFVMDSRQWAEGPCLAEKIGAVCVLSRLEPGADGLRMHLTGWRFLGLPLPAGLAPRIATREWEEAGRYRFDVTVGLPVTGHRLIRYHGYLSPQAAPLSAPG